MPGSIQGVYYDGATSAKREAALLYTEDGRVGISDSGKSPVALSALTVSSRIGDTPRYIEFPSGGQFETRDNEGVDAMLAALGGRDSLAVVHFLERNKRFVLLTILILAGFSWGLVKYGIPYFSREVSLLLPDQASAYMGDGVLDAMDKGMLEPSALSAERREELTRLFDSLARHTGETLPLTIRFRAGGPMGANAFALPNGVIVFTDEIVRLADDNRELAAVMLHEMGHVHYRHSLRMAFQQFSLAMFVTLVTGDVSASSSVIAALPVMLVKSGYSRDMEWEADGYALNQMRQAGIAPEYFADMMDRLEASHTRVYAQCLEEGAGQGEDCMQLALEHLQDKGDEGESLSSYLSTHPMSEQRAERFRQAQAR